MYTPTHIATVSRHVRRKIGLLVACASLYVLCNILQQTLDGPITEIYDDYAATQETGRNLQGSGYARLDTIRKWLSTPTMHCNNLSLIGNDGDRICNDTPWSPQASCLSYSFGDGTITSLSFDVAMVMRGCHAHTFDPQLETLSPHEDDMLLSAGVRVHKALLSSRSSVGGRSGARVTLSGALNTLNENATKLDYLRVRPKIGGRPILLTMLSQQLRAGESSALVLDKVSQMSVLVSLPDNVNTMMDSSSSSSTSAEDSAHMTAMFVIDTLETAATTLHQLGFRVAHTRLVAAQPKGTTGNTLSSIIANQSQQIYHVLLVRSGRDIWDRMQRYAPAKHDFTRLLSKNMLAV